MGDSSREVPLRGALGVPRAHLCAATTLGLWLGTGSCRRAGKGLTPSAAALSHLFLELELVVRNFFSQLRTFFLWKVILAWAVCLEGNDLGDSVSWLTVTDGVPGAKGSQHGA